MIYIYNDIYIYIYSYIYIYIYILYILLYTIKSSPGCPPRTLLLLPEARDGGAHRGGWARAQGPAATSHDPDAGAPMCLKKTDRKRLDKITIHFLNTYCG